MALQALDGSANAASQAGAALSPTRSLAGSANAASQSGASGVSTALSLERVVFDIALQFFGSATVDVGIESPPAGLASRSTLQVIETMRTPIIVRGLPMHPEAVSNWSATVTGGMTVHAPPVIPDVNYDPVAGDPNIIDVTDPEDTGTPIATYHWIASSESANLGQYITSWTDQVSSKQMTSVFPYRPKVLKLPTYLRSGKSRVRGPSFYAIGCYSKYSEYMEANMSAFSTPCTYIFVVSRTFEYGTSTRTRHQILQRGGLSLYMYSSESSSPRGYGPWYLETQNKTPPYLSGGDYQRFGATQSGMGESFTVVTGVWNGSSSLARQRSRHGTREIKGTTKSITLGNVRIANKESTARRIWSQYAEILFFNKALTKSEYTKIEDGLISKYRINQYG